MPDEDLNRRMEAVEKLVGLFRLERIVHLAVTSIALAMLLLTAGFLLIKQSRGQSQLPELTLMFGSSGLITYSASRLLQMWNQAISLIVPNAKVSADGHS